ncbi:MAG TPA: enoyl-CoA hydratase-related protein [Actinomycetota bacterium]|nr:enoyl-CoA hydratase-related protein [Actinomycetota bacterium]
MSEAVTTRFEGEVAWVTLRRPERRNALDAASAAAVARAVEEAGGRARAIVLHGAGGAFCAGGDLDELRSWAGRSHDEIASTLYGSFQAMIRAVRGTDAVVVAAITGPAVGAGMDLALACDLRVAGRGARLGQVWVRLGVIPGTGGAFLTQALTGPGRAAELLLTGDLIDAEAALAAGLVNAVVEDDRVLEEADALTRRILRHPAAGVAANKRAYVAATDEAVEAALRHAARVQPERFTSDEFRAAVERVRR